MKENLLRILLISSNPLVTNPILDILQRRDTLKIFDTYEAETVADGFREIEKEKPDLILYAASLKDKTDTSNFNRLHEHAPQIPILILLEDKFKAQTLEWIHLGAQNSLFMSQITPESLPAYLVRAIEKFSTQKTIRESEERFRKLIEHASDVITTLESSGTITFTGPSTERILKYPHADLVGQNLLDFIHRDDRLGFLKHFEKAFSDGGALQPINFRFRHQAGHFLHMEGKGRIAEDAAGQPICVLNAHDISHRVQLEEELRSLSLRDALTGLHNRRSFIGFFDQQLKDGRRSQKKGLYLLFIDLDGFKWINDNLGHKVGDEALIEAARVLKTTFRQADIIARLGGDEFVVLLSEGGEEINTEVVRERLMKGLDAWNTAQDRPYKLAMSIGVLHHDLGRPGSSEEILSKADALMFDQKRAKKRGARPTD